MLLMHLQHHDRQIDRQAGRSAADKVMFTCINVAVLSQRGNACFVCAHVAGGGGGVCVCVSVCVCVCGVGGCLLSGL